MKNDAIRPNVLGVKIISNISPEMAKKLNLEQHHKSLGLINDSNQIDINAEITREILTTIKNKCNFGQSTTGRDLIEHFTKRPYGWNPIILRIVLATLFRNGSIVAIHQQRAYQDHTEFGAKDIFSIIL